MSKPRPGRPEHAPVTRYEPDEASIALAPPEPMEGNALLTHPAAWYLYLPGHKQHVGPVTTDRYAPGQPHCMINIDRDQRGRTFGIEVL